MDERVGRTVETYEANAEAYAERNADRGPVAPVAESFLDRVDGQRVLDVGCGPGWETATFADAALDVVGIDASPTLLDDASERAPPASFVLGDARSPPFPSDSFDGVWACASLLHVPREELGDALAELARILVAGGVLTATVKSTEYDRRTDHYDGERHFEYYDVEEFPAYVERNGFAVSDWSHTDDGWILVHARTR